MMRSQTPPLQTRRHAASGAAVVAPTQDFIRWDIRRTSLGWALIATSDKGVCAILLGDEPDVLEKDFRRRFPKAIIVETDDDFDRNAKQVIALIEAPQTQPTFPLDARGTDFQKRVWKALCAIETGATASYADIAKQIGAPKATRAVAGACALPPRHPRRRRAFWISLGRRAQTGASDARRRNVKHARRHMSAEQPLL